MIAVTVLLLVAVADVVRQVPAVPARRRGTWWVAAAVLVAGCALVLGASVPLLVALGAAAVAGAWALTMPVRGPGESRRLWPALVLLLVLGAGALAPTRALAGPLVRAWERTALGAPSADAVPVEVALGVLAVALALTRTANIITRAALARARRDDVVEATTPGAAQGAADDAGERRASLASGGWRLSVRGRDVAAVVRAPSAVAAGPVLRGGRLIGPLERLLVLVLGLAGVYPVIAAVLAAKGIVRFPEISADRAHGTKAEEFLIGSLVSWSTAGAGVLLVRVLAA